MRYRELKKVKATLYFPPDLIRRVRRIAADTGRSDSETAATLIAKGLGVKAPWAEKSFSASA